ncbi:hypothetical protein SMICM17S_00357 [Streptomyces microflavus]
MRGAIDDHPVPVGTGRRAVPVEDEADAEHGRPADGPPDGTHRPLPYDRRQLPHGELDGDDTAARTPYAHQEIGPFVHPQPEADLLKSLQTGKGEKLLPRHGRTGPGRGKVQADEHGTTGQGMPRTKALRLQVTQ